MDSITKQLSLSGEETKKGRVAFLYEKNKNETVAPKIMAIFIYSVLSTRRQQNRIDWNRCMCRIYPYIPESLAADKLHMDNTHCHVDFPWVDHTRLVTSHVCWYLECATFWTRRRSRAYWAFHSRTHTRRTRARVHTQLLAFPVPICSEDVCQCSIKIPSDKRFKWLPLWVMRSRISEEALTAQHMKTDELDCPSLPEAGAGIVPRYH